MKERETRKRDGGKEGMKEKEERKEGRKDGRRDDRWKERERQKEGRREMMEGRGTFHHNFRIKSTNGITLQNPNETTLKMDATSSLKDPSPCLQSGIAFSEVCILPFS